MIANMSSVRGTRRPGFAWQRVYPPDSVLPPHVHTAPRLCIVLNGSFDENTADGWQRHEAGTLLYRPSGYAHEERFGLGGATCAVFELEPQFVDILHSDGFDSASPAALSSMSHIAAALRREAQIGDAFSAASCQSLIWQAFVLLGRMRAVDERMAAIAQQARRHIEQRFRQQTGLGATAAALSVAPATLARAFALEFGMSIGEFVQRRRIDEAAALLSEGKLPIAELALECGFSSQAHLTATFRKFKGTTPARFRRATC
jgi:AraC-like DNA-binding protein